MRRIEKRTSSAIFLLLTSFSISAIAEPKMLVCETPAEGEHEMAVEYAAQYKKDLAKYEDPSSSLHILASSTRESVKEWDLVAERCKTAEWGVQRNFSFNTKGLTDPSYTGVEIQVTNLCGLNPGGKVTGTLEATPTTITFTQPGDVFMVDRKTLTGGHNFKRDHSCKLLDVDTSENLL